MIGVPDIISIHHILPTSAAAMAYQRSTCCEGLKLYPKHDITQKEYARMCIAMGQAFNRLHGYTTEADAVTVEPEQSSKGGLVVAFPTFAQGDKHMRFFGKTRNLRGIYHQSDAYVPSGWDYSTTGMAGWLNNDNVIIPFNMAYTTILHGRSGAYWTTEEIDIMYDIMTRFGFRCKGWKNVRTHPYSIRHMNPTPAVYNYKRDPLALELTLGPPIEEGSFKPGPLPMMPLRHEVLLQETMQDLFNASHQVYMIRDITGASSVFVLEANDHLQQIWVYTEKQFKARYADIHVLDKKDRVQKFASKWLRRKLFEMASNQAQYKMQWNVDWHATLRPGYRRIHAAEALDDGADE